MLLLVVVVMVLIVLLVVLLLIHGCRLADLLVHARIEVHEDGRLQKVILMVLSLSEEIVIHGIFIVIFTAVAVFIVMVLFARLVVVHFLDDFAKHHIQRVLEVVLVIVPADEAVGWVVRL